MRKTLTLTAAALAAVIFFVLATLPPRPTRLAAAGGPAGRTLAGAYHVHSLRSDGGGDRAAIAAAAARAGLGFVILTDHGDGTRRPEPPAYVGGVLLVDAVEVSTAGGHYTALGVEEAPYPLGGEPEGVIEDVARLGGFGFAAHPDSPRAEVAWSAWEAPLDGLEWLNADSEWRNETRTRLARVLLDYPFRPGPALASILDRPAGTLERWDRLTAVRRVAAIAGHDAHGGIGRSAEYRGTSRRPAFAPGIPSYEASFRTFSTRVLLDRAPTGDAAADAAALVASIRRGRMFTAIDAIAGPAALDFHAVRGSARIEMGEEAPPGPAVIRVRAATPAGARLVLLSNGREVAAADGGTLDADLPHAAGAYRVEVRVPGGPGDPPVPWLVSNPVYFLAPRAATPVEQRSAALPLPSEVGWHVEKDRWSAGSVVRSVEDVAFFYRLHGPGRGSQYAAAVADLQGRAPAGGAIAFTATAVRPVRLSVQLRYRRGGGARWRRSVYLDETPREIRLPIAGMRPADGQTGPVPPATQAMSLLFVVDLVNALPGSANTVRLSRVGFAP